MIRGPSYFQPTDSYSPTYHSNISVKPGVYEAYYNEGATIRHLLDFQDRCLVSGSFTSSSDGQHYSESFKFVQDFCFHSLYHYLKKQEKGMDFYQNTVEAYLSLFTIERTEEIFPSNFYIGPWHIV